MVNLPTKYALILLVLTLAMPTMVTAGIPKPKLPVHIEVLGPGPDGTGPDDEGCLGELVPKEACDVIDIIGDIISDLFCGWTGSGLGAGLSPVTVDIPRHGAGVADNLLTGGLPGDYDSYSGVAVLC